MARPRRPAVGIIMGSSSDAAVMSGAGEVLDGLGVVHEDQIVSAHRTPARIARYARHAEEAGIRIIIAGAGGAAHLPGMVASHTVIPVIGVPILVYNYKHKGGRGAGGGTGKAAAGSARAAGATKISAFGGLDSLLSITEMPSGSPVASVGVNKAANAGLYAARILAAGSPALRRRLVGLKSDRRRAVLAESAELRRKGLSRFVADRLPLGK